MDDRATSNRSTQTLIRGLMRESKSAIQSASIRNLTYQGWESLQERNQDGSVVGILPYTPEAIEYFRKAYQVDHVNLHLVHHLAIATHAYAWDLELAQDPQAAELWKEAFGYWRELTASPKFWEEMKSKYKSLATEEEFNQMGTAIVDQLRHGLLEDLLDIHVEFVRYWTEKGIPDQCQVHLDIIRTAVLPPVVKKKFAGKVYEILTAGVQEACARQAFESALTSLERFLNLFPDYLPALRDVSEVCGKWLDETLSYLDDWDEIEKLGERVKDRMQYLAQHPEIESDPVAKMKFEEMTNRFTRKAYDRGYKYGTSNNSSNKPESPEKAKPAYTFAIEWGRLGLKFSSRGSPLRNLLSVSLNNKAVILSSEVSDIYSSTVSIKTRDRAIRNVYLEVIEYVEEAIQVDGEHENFVNNRKIYQDRLTEVEMRIQKREL